MNIELTPEQITEMGKMWGKTYLECLPAEEVLSHFEPQELLSHFKPRDILAVLTPRDILAVLKPQELFALP